MGNFDVKINTSLLNNEQTEVLIALLADFGFEGFIEEEHLLRAFIPSADASKEDIDSYINTLPFDHKPEVDIALLEEKNWNEEWEKNFFKPIRIDNQCLVRSSFHPAEPDIEFEILVDPKMAFGTGHHATTFLMLEELLKTDLKDKIVLDMGCGTGILAILSALKGSKHIQAIDIDKWAFDNTLENIAINKVSGIETILGGTEKLGQTDFDVIIANINRNILLEDMHSYASVLSFGGKILFSGFYEKDLELIKKEADKQSLKYSYHKTKDNWTMAAFIKK